MIRFLSSILALSVASAANYQLKPTPTTVAWGYYYAAATPVLHVKSGDTVEIQTLTTANPTMLEAVGLPPGEVEQSLRDIYREVKDKGPGGHILLGPVAIDGAEPGDVLEVRIQSIKLAVPYSTVAVRPKAGFLPDDFVYSRSKLVRLDEKTGIAHFSDGIDIPIRPFFGSMGVAPPESAGRLSSAPPGTHAGNMDNRELVAGTTLFIPGFASGAKFEVGDGHAAQGNGDVCITALETSLIGVFQFIVRKDLHLRWPRAETPTHYITMGMPEDRTDAARLAVREATRFLVTQHDLRPRSTCQVSSVAA